MAGAWHHPNRKEHPSWVIYLNHWWHKAATIAQRMKPTPENLAALRGFIDSLEYEYLDKRRQLDVEEKIGEGEAQ